MSCLILFTNSFPYANGEAFLETEIKYLSTAFERIIIQPLSYQNSQTKRQLPTNINVLTPLFDNLKNKNQLLILGIFNLSPLLPFVNEFFNKFVWKRTSHLRSWLTSVLIGRSLFANKETQKVLQTNKDALLYFYWGDNAAWIIPLLPPEISNKIIVRNHRTDLYEYLHHDYIPLKERILERTSMISLISMDGFDYLSKKYSQFKTKIFLNYLGVEPAGKNPDNITHSFTIVSCSSLLPVKRVSFIVEILLLIKDLDITWVHFGSGKGFAELKQVASTLPKNIKVILKGEVKNTEVLKFYLNQPIDLFMNVSLSEGLPVSIMEAFSCGIPVLATDVGGSKELVTIKNGILVWVTDNAKNISLQIKKFLTLPHEQKNIYRSNAFHTWEERVNAKKNYMNFCNQLKELYYNK